MRVLHIGKYAPSYLGGIESYLGHLMTALNAEGIQTHALVHAYQRQRPSTPGYTVVPTVGRPMNIPVSPAFPAALDRAIGAFAPAVLHIHMPNASAFSVLWSAGARSLPWVVHWHADVMGSGGWALRAGYRFYRYLERRLLSRSAAIIATSPPYLEASDTLRPWRDRVEVIPLGCPCLPPDADAVSTVDSYWPGDRSRVLFVGRASYYKGLKHLLEAVADATTAGLIVVGPGTQGTLGAEVRRRGLQDRVLLLDRQPGQVVRALMATAHCLCVPSTGREEAFGMVAIEAMAQGLPVLASEIQGSGLPWLIEPGLSGEVVPVRDVAALARTLDGIEKDRGTWVRMGKAAHHRFERLFDIRNSVASIRALYHAVSRNVGVNPGDRY